MDADVIVVGHGLAGLVVAGELADAGKRVILLDQESAANLGGQAWWSLGGLFLVDSPEQRRLRITDSAQLAWRDWENSAGWDRLTYADGTRGPDHWGRAWAQAYVEWAAGDMREWVTGHGISFFPIVGWAERGDGSASGHGNSVPRFHISWGTGTGVVRPFARRVHDHITAGRIDYRPRHRVDAVEVTGGVVTGTSGAVLAEDDAARGVATSREVVGSFAVSAQAVLVASGGIGGDHDLVRAAWPERLGRPPTDMVTGVPAYVDGRMIALSEDAGARVVNRDRMWHYVEGVRNWSPMWPGHGIRILPGPSSLWFDALGNRLPPPFLPGYDTLGTLAHLRASGYDHSWFITNRAIAGKEFALSGSEQNLDLTNGGPKDVARVLATRARTDVYPAVADFLRHGADFVTASTATELAEAMNALTDEPLLNPAYVAEQVSDRDAQLSNGFGKDTQIAAVRQARRYVADRVSKRAYPLHRITDPGHGPLVGVKLSVLSRKTLGGLLTNLSGQVIGAAGAPLQGLYAAGEVAGFGGGGLHGYRALEGTFLGGCLFTGRAAGRALAADLG
ncbi:MAG: FAD-binding dehydrogenase [Nostocoides sp.]